VHYECKQFAQKKNNNNNTHTCYHTADDRQYKHLTSTNNVQISQSLTARENQITSQQLANKRHQIDASLYQEQPVTTAAID